MDNESESILISPLNDERDKNLNFIRSLPNEIILHIIEKASYDNDWIDDFKNRYYMILGKLRLVNRRWSDMICGASHLWRYVYISHEFFGHIEKSFNDNMDFFCVEKAQKSKLTLIIYSGQRYIDLTLDKYLSRIDTIHLGKSVHYDTKIHIFKYLGNNPKSVKTIVYYNNMHTFRREPIDLRTNVSSIENFIIYDSDDKIFQHFDFRNVKRLTLVNFLDCKKLLDGLNMYDKLVYLKLQITNDYYLNVWYLKSIKDNLPYVTLENLEYLFFDLPNSPIAVQNIVQSNSTILSTLLHSYDILNQIKIPNVKTLYLGNFTLRYTIPDCKVKNLHIESTHFKGEIFVLQQLYKKIEKYKKTLSELTLQFTVNDNSIDWIRKRLLKEKVCDKVYTIRSTA